MNVHFLNFSLLVEFLYKCALISSDEFSTTFCTVLTSGGFRWVVSMTSKPCRSSPSKQRVLFSHTRKLALVYFNPPDDIGMDKRAE